MEQINFALYILLLILSILFGIWLLHTIFIYYRLYKLEIPSLRGRYSHIVIWICILGASYFLIYTPFSILSFHYGLDDHLYFPYVINAILTQITALIYPFLIVYRSWMVYFKIRWMMAIEDTKWSIFIDQNAQQNNFYLRNYKKNRKYASKILSIMWALFTFLTLFFVFLGPSYANIALSLYGLQYFLPILMLTVLLCKIPKYDDIFHIKKEIKLIIIASLITTILYGPFLVIASLVPIWGQFILRIYALIGPFCILSPHFIFSISSLSFT